MIVDCAIEIKRAQGAGVGCARTLRCRECDPPSRRDASAAEALAILDRETFQVFVSDLAMPGEDGLALVRAIRPAVSARLWSP